MNPFIHRYYTLEQPIGGVASWVDAVPAFKALRAVGRLDFRAPITVITAENGVGKSTLLEGIAVSCGFNDHGGPYGAPVAGRDNPLRNVASVIHSSRAMEGYFLRAESHFNVASQYGNNAPGGVNLHQMSHGESVMQIVQEAFAGHGLYLLDEPESGLSTIRQLALLAELHACAEAGAQIIMATHSPVLLAIPGAEIWEFTAEGGFNRGIGVEETLPFLAMRDFLEDPEEIAEFMVEVTGD